MRISGFEFFMRLSLILIIFSYFFLHLKQRRLKRALHISDLISYLCIILFNSICNCGECLLNSILLLYSKFAFFL